MQLSISHTTHYKFESPPDYGLQQLRLTPKSSAGQTVAEWSLDIQGAQTQAVFDDEHKNRTQLVSINAGAHEIIVTSKGLLDMSDQGGIFGEHRGFAPLWLFLRQTPLTQPGDKLREVVGLIPENPGISDLHALSADIAARVIYTPGVTGSETSAEEALLIGKGVCQDHAHIFITAVRLAGHPARYVSGYLLMNDRVHQDATHAWAEVWLEGLGWTGFDVSNGISPDDRYVRLATGLDYIQAAPISGLTMGGSGESIEVDLHVQQQ